MKYIKNIGNIPFHIYNKLLDIVNLRIHDSKGNPKFIEFAVIDKKDSKRYLGNGKLSEVIYGYPVKDSCSIAITFDEIYLWRLGRHVSAQVDIDKELMSKNHNFAISESLDKIDFLFIERKEENES